MGVQNWVPLGTGSDLYCVHMNIENILNPKLCSIENWVAPCSIAGSAGYHGDSCADPVPAKEEGGCDPKTLVVRMG